MLLALLALACNHGGPPSLCDGAEGGQPGENVLVILTDDIGIDNTAVYGEHPDPPPTPNIDALAARGVLFRNAYASPVCSPTRASLLTGRLPTRTGVGNFIQPDLEWVRLADAELTIPELLEHSPDAYTSAAVGKWHLTSFLFGDPAQHPLDQGFTCHAGSLANPMEATLEPNMARGYDRWEKATDGGLAWTGRYMISDATDEALARVANTPEPWFLYVAYNGAHNPLHNPPADLHGQQLDADASDTEMYRAMVEATDTELGRLLDGIPPEILARTTVIYSSDNGTPVAGITEPWDPERRKGTVYEGGVNVPLIIAGPHVSRPGSESRALVHLVDVLPTVAELAQVPLEQVLADRDTVIDGYSLMGLVRDPSLPGARETLYTEGFTGEGELPAPLHLRMVRDRDWKLIRREEGGQVSEELFRFAERAWDEGPDLLAQGLPAGGEAEAALQRLRSELDQVVAELSDSSTWNHDAIH